MRFLALRGCLKSLIYYLPWRLEVAATRNFTHLRGFKTLHFLLVCAGGETSAAIGFPGAGDWQDRMRTFV
jgi:hypothetical protein